MVGRWVSVGYLWSGIVFKACFGRTLTCLSTGSPYGRRIATISTGRPHGIWLVGVKRECNDESQFTYNFDSARHLPMITMSSV